MGSRPYPMTFWKQIFRIENKLVVTCYVSPPRYSRHYICNTTTFFGGDCLTDKTRYRAVLQIASVHSNQPDRAREVVLCARLRRYRMASDPTSPAGQ